MKKWINKQTAVAFILGIAITLSVPVAAATKAIKEAEFNTSTSITVNGQAVPLELVAVTLEGDTNGSNYAPVKALAEAMGGTVAYDSKTKVIDIATDGATTSAAVIVPAQQTKAVTSTVQPASVSLNDIQVCDINGKKGVPLETLQKYLNGKRCWLAKNEDGSYRLVEITETTTLSITSFIDNGTEYITYETYERRILPRLPRIDKYADTPDFKTPN